MRGGRTFVVVAAVLAMIATGCGRGEDAADDTDPGTPPVHTFKASEMGRKSFAFELPSNVLTGGGITIRLRNDGKEVHNFQLVKAVLDHTLEELVEQMTSEHASFPDWVEPVGGVGTTAPGETNEATVVLDSGNYWYFCTEVSGEGESSVAHAKAGMSGQLTLLGQNGAYFPAANAKIAATENGFYFDGTIAGDRTLVWVNDGQQPHHATLLPVAAGKSFAQAKEALLSDDPPDGRSPIEFENRIATAVLGPGQRLVTDIRLRKGTYVLACLLPDKGTTGPPHTTKGMLVEVRVQ